MEQSRKPIIDFLIVDDQITMLRAIRTMLKHLYQDKRVEIVDNGKNALEILRNFDVRFVITDWNMPLLNGIELLKIIRKNPRWHEIPVLMISDELSREKFLYALEESVDGYQLKPFTEEKLITSINSILRARQKQTPIQLEISTIRRLILFEKYDEAVEQARQLSQNEQSLETLLLLSESCFQKGDFDNSRITLEKIIAIKPLGRALHLLGKICTAEKKYNDALTYLQQAIEINPLNLDQKIDAGRTFLSLGMMGEAEEMFKSIIQANPTYLAYVEIGKAYLEHDELEAAAGFLDKVPELIPETVEVYISFAIELLKAGDFERSIQQFRRCQKLSADNTLLLFHLGKAFSANENNKNAKIVLCRVLDLDQNHEEAFNLLLEIVTGNNQKK